MDLNKIYLISRIFNNDNVHKDNVDLNLNGTIFLIKLTLLKNFKLKRCILLKMFVILLLYLKLKIEKPI